MTIWDKMRQLGKVMPQSVVNTDRRYDMGTLKDNPNDKLEAHKPAYDSIYAKPQTLDGLIYGEIPQQSVTNYIDPRRGILAVNSLTARSVAVGLQSWQSNVSWNNSVLGTISWPEHTLALADGTTYTIAADSFTPSNTNLHYIYWKKGWSEYKVTENVDIATGQDKIIVATFQKGSDTRIQVWNGNSSGTLINGNNITTGRIQGPGGRQYLDVDSGVLNFADASNDRVRFTPEDTLLAGITKPGYDVDTATDDQFLFKVTSTGIKTYFSKTFSSAGNTNPNVFNWGTSSIIYDSSGDTNTVIMIDFYKDSAWTISSLKLQAKFTPGEYYNGSGFTVTYQTNNKAYLNPTMGAALGSSNPYHRFSGGTTLRMDGEGADAFNLGVSALTFTDTFSAGEISSISNGWNTIVIQTDNDSSSAFSYGVLNINMIGYETIS